MTYKSLSPPDFLITSVEVDSEYGINVHEQLRLIESGKLTPYERILPRTTPYPLRMMGQLRFTKYSPLSWEKIWSLDRQRVEELFFKQDQIEALSKPADCAEEITDKAASREEVARGARRDRVIRIIDLIDIMAEDETYTDILPALRKKFLLRSWIGPREFDDLLQTPEGRFRYWLNLIRRWAGLEANATEERLPYISYLQCYSHNSKTGKIEKVDRNGKAPYHKNFINLDELKKHLKNVEYIYQLQIPLPQRLYPEDIIVADEGEKQLSDSAKAKKVDRTEAAYRKLGAAIDYELSDTPDLPPDNSQELRDLIFKSKNIRKIINRDIQSKSDPYVIRRLSKLGLLDERLKLKGGRPSKNAVQKS